MDNFRRVLRKLTLPHTIDFPPSIHIPCRDTMPPSIVRAIALLLCLGAMECEIPANSICRKVTFYDCYGLRCTGPVMLHTVCASRHPRTAIAALIP